MPSLDPPEIIFQKSDITVMMVRGDRRFYGSDVPVQSGFHYVEEALAWVKTDQAARAARLARYLEEAPGEVRRRHPDLEGEAFDQMVEAYRTGWKRDFRPHYDFYLTRDLKSLSVIYEGKASDV